MTLTTTYDQAAAEEFVGRVLADTSAAMVTTLSALGDRLGIYKDLASAGPATSEELAQRTGLNARYVREWCSAIAAHGYLTYDPQTEVFTLPPEHVPALAEEDGPMFFGGSHEMLTAINGVLDGLADAFRNGGGVAQSAYGRHWWDGMERFTAGVFEHQLVQLWIAQMPQVEQKLRDGALVADVGCGRGRALVKLAQAFPQSRFTGFDVHEPSLERARAQAAAAGVGDRVHFHLADGADGLPGSFDVITTFDVVHDAVDPLGLLTAIRGALADDGRYVCADINASHRLEDNAGPLGAMLYSFSVLYCMTTSLAHGGAGLGTCGFNETTVRELCAKAGFGEVRVVPIDDPFNLLYEISAG
jgi:SAM-dependent methyltransferase